MAGRNQKITLSPTYSQVEVASRTPSMDSEPQNLHSRPKLEQLKSTSYSPRDGSPEQNGHQEEKERYDDGDFNLSSITDLVLTSSEIPSQDLATLYAEHDPKDLRNKYKQLKDKYIRLHKNYKKTKNLRVYNETLVNKTKQYEGTIQEMQNKLRDQKDTITRQNRHLLTLRKERDDFEDTIGVQAEEMRLTEQYGSPLFAITPISSKSLKKDDGGHMRSGTTPLTFKQTKSLTDPPLDEDPNFQEDPDFTMTFVPNDLDDDDDDEMPQPEEKQQTHTRASVARTPGGPTPGGPQEQVAGSNKKARFVERDDITRDVEQKYYNPDRIVPKSMTNPHRVSDLWAAIIGENTDGTSIVEQSAEICDAWSVDECECGQRLLFILKYYGQWLNHKQQILKRKSRANRNVFNQSNYTEAISEDKSGYTESISEFIGGCLRYYNDIQLLNDFFHVKKYHMSNPSHFNSDDVFQHFVSEFGFCDVKHCTSFRRNHREKSIFGHHNRFRRKVYHLDKKQFKHLDEYDEHADNRYELHEIYMQQCLDMIHSTLIHEQQNTTMDNLSEFAKQLLKSPVSFADDPEYSEPMSPAASSIGTPNSRATSSNVRAGGSTRFGYKQVINSVSQRTARVSVIERAHGRGSPAGPNASPIPLSPQQEDPASNTQDVFAYGFGVRFSYWIREWPDYVQSKHGDLRSELLENDIYRVSAFEWDLLEHRAAVFLQSTHGISEYVARRKGSGNELMQIPVGARLSIDHLIALFTYTNYPNIRIAFQKACLRITPDEAFATVLKRHEQIACWARLLYEAVYLFGCKMADEDRFYHILRSKIMLRKFSANLSCPTTMIANRKIVNNSNIVMQVANAHSRGTTYFDISCFSDVPNREERLFFFGDVAFDNIILKGKSHRHYIKSLTLFQKIVQGSYFYHTPLHQKKYQQTIGHFMHNLMASKDGGECSNYVHMLADRKKYNDEDIIKDNDVPLYMQHLFDYFCGRIKTIWINQEEFSRLTSRIAKYFAKTKQNASIVSIHELMLSSSDKQSMMGEFSKFLHFEYAANIKYCCTLHWEISGNALRQFRKGEKVFGEEFRVSTIRLFPYIVKDSSKNDGQFRFGIPVKSMPKYLKKIEFRVDLYIAEINYSFSAFSVIDERGTYWYSLFDSSSLRNADQFTLKISFRLINLIVTSASHQNVRAVNTQKGHPVQQNSVAPHRGSVNSIFNLENFRRVSNTQRKSVVARLSRVSHKFTQKNEAEDVQKMV
eukprot:151438_1